MHVDVFPAGIDFGKFEHITSQPAVKNRADHLKTLFKDKYVIVSRDRVDEVEGVPMKLKALEFFLQKYPQWNGKIVHFQVGRDCNLVC